MEHKKEISRFIDSDRGSASVFFVVATVLIASFALGNLFILNKWKNRVAIQLKLSDCVGDEIQDMRNALTRIQAINKRMKEIRISIVASTMVPEVAAVLRGTLGLLAGRLLLETGRWHFKMGSWFTKCPKAFHLPYPQFPFVVLPADAIGPRPYPWATPKRSFTLLLKQNTRIARAETFLLPMGWKTRWKPRPLSHVMAKL